MEPNDMGARHDTYDTMMSLSFNNFRVTILNTTRSTTADVRQSWGNVTKSFRWIYKYNVHTVVV